MKIRILLLLLCLGMAENTPAQTFQFPDAELWERQQAWHLANSVDTAKEKQIWQQSINGGDTDGALNLLQTIDSRTDLSAPAREKLLFDMVTQLHQSTPGSVDSEIMTYFKSYASRVMIPHEDHPRAHVPMFNIKSAAVGVQNNWLHQTAAIEGSALLSEGPQALVQHFLKTPEAPARRGLIASLQNASPTQMNAITATASAQIRTSPELFELAGEAALLSGDPAAIGKLLAGASGPSVSRLLNRGREILNAQQIEALFSTALDSESHETAALAIATLGAPLAGQSTIDALLLARLDDPQLGASAALALARGGNPETLAELRTISATNFNTVLGQRARLALRLHTTQFGEETAQ